MFGVYLCATWLHLYFTLFQSIVNVMENIYAHSGSISSINSSIFYNVFNNSIMRHWLWLFIAGNGAEQAEVISGNIWG